MAELGGDLTELEMRVAALEQVFASTHTGIGDGYFDTDAMVTVVNDPLDWSVANNGWESYTKIGPPITDPTDEYYPGGAWSTPYAMASASRLGSMCVLTGMVRRKAGAANLAAGSANLSPMFALPLNWQPTADVILPCLMGNTDPSGTAVVGTAWIEVRENDVADTGVAYFRSGTVACNANTGWIALQGLVPISVNEAGLLVEDSWDDASPTTTWNMVDPSVTWNTYPPPDVYSDGDGT
jgi:hypothetical protein